ncbi:SMC-Scp complex subunit ScpB [Proteiniclasticum sp. QWL-01]|uniref:SMC-Scp complex subunit ScpB n=1 Tax=Proteiniclasticum sp. QWL-01 TaxID=3036945 RepID=UPI00240FA66A|nr:SMC-Scp complex subunit ScpB [Proteiniclasticum sp. QWL-01]WFF71437.1 SMC-Scp complex subunit ScpB [Proteiniclasticum sp. QWL-01]
MDRLEHGNKGTLIRKEELKGRLEAVLFAAGDPMTVREMATLLDVVPDAVEMLLEEMALDYARAERGLQIIRLEDRIQLTTKLDYSSSVLKLAQVNERQTLSKGALECLAIIAYKQPVTRVEVDEIRGVSSDYVLSKLLERSFITVIGRKNVPGKPKLYATTDEFLRQFGFSNLKAFSEDETYQSLLRRVGTGSEEGDLEILPDDDEGEETQLTLWGQEKSE